ncbi:MAG: hypothetical protein KF745_00125 [Phycisphaeraceae bacterium]|nr:hypothetical protein [Phycisphaeraceae bacterium]
MPKCPACVAGYILLFTGIGLSVPTAAVVRWALLIASVAALIFLLTRLMVSVVRLTKASRGRLTA